MEKIIDALKKSKNVLILTHTNPDGDAIGSSTALKKALEKMGKRADVLLERNISEKFSFLEDEISFELPDIRYDTVAALDCAEPERMGEFAGLYTGETVNIDHHYSNPCFGKYNLTDGSAAATGEILFEVLENLGTELDKEIAERLYIALLTDTGGFMFSNTSAKTHKIAAKLISCGVDLYDINNRFMIEKSLDKLKIEAYCINNMELYYQNKICVFALPSETCAEIGLTENKTTGLSSLSRSIKGVEVGILITEITEGKIKISMRSDKLADVSEIAAKFGGGGHRRAAGITVCGKDFNEIKEKVISETINELKELC